MIDRLPRRLRRICVYALTAFLMALVASGPKQSAEGQAPLPGTDLTALTAGLMPRVKHRSGCGADCTPSPALVIKGQHGRIVRNIRIDGAPGDCTSIEGGRDIVLENVELANCGRDGLRVVGARSVTVRNVVVRNTHGNAATLEDSSDVTVTDSLFEAVASGVYALTSTGIVVRGNLIKNVRGPKPRGQGVQYDKVTGRGNAVMCNLIVNEPGRSNAEDAINMFLSRGTTNAPILIAGNRVLGGGPSPSGGGILVGDHGGAYIHVFQNRLVDPGQYGVAIAGGSHMELVANKVFARRQPFANVGLYVWKIDNGDNACHSHTVIGNAVDYTNAEGKANPSWDAENCGDVEGFAELNRWDVPLAPAILRDPLPVCERP